MKGEKLISKKALYALTLIPNTLIGSENTMVVNATTVSVAVTKVQNTILKNFYQHHL